MSNGKYLTGYWEHIFPGEKSPRMTQILVDAAQGDVLGALVQRNRAVEDSYTRATADEINDLHDSINNANAEVFENPEDYGLKVIDEAPGWFKA